MGVAKGRTIVNQCFRRSGAALVAAVSLAGCLGEIFTDRQNPAEEPDQDDQIGVDGNATSPPRTSSADWSQGFCLYGHSLPEPGPPASAANVLFPTVTALPDGLVLVAGGFAKILSVGEGFEIVAPTNRGYLLDAATGVVLEAEDDMNAARGAHAAVLLPDKDLVLIVGGAGRLYRSEASGCFPWYFRRDSAGQVGRSYELFDVKTHRFLQWDTPEWPDLTDDPFNPAQELPTHTMAKDVPRVFPSVSLNHDGTVIVAGGGPWPSCDLEQGQFDPDYQVAEIYRPKDENHRGGFMETYGALTMQSMRTGHAAALVKIENKLAVHLFWGGTQDKPYAEMYREPSGQLDGNFGSFQAVDWVVDFEKRMYFSSLTGMGDDSFLVAGGMMCSGAGMSPPSSDNAFIATVKEDLQVSVSMLQGLEHGRYFHAAVSSPEHGQVLLIGGFGTEVSGSQVVFADMALSDTRLCSGFSQTASEPQIDPPLERVAGHGAVALPDGRIMLAGGVESMTSGIETDTLLPPPMRLQQLVPKDLCQDSGKTEE